MAAGSVNVGETKVGGVRTNDARVDSVSTSGMSTGGVTSGMGTGGVRTDEATSICPRCARRDWLLDRLSLRLDFRTRDLARFWSLLELSDRDLIEAIGGKRRDELRADYARCEPVAIPAGAGVEAICRHHRAYPARLRDSLPTAHTLRVCGGTRRLSEMLEGTVVAIVGTRRASDYGMETARGLARGLAAAGVTIASGLSEGIPIAAHAGALEAKGATLTVTVSPVERCSPAWCAALYRRLISEGCVISETPSSTRARAWRNLARARTLARLAQLVIVVEAEERPWELACAHIAQDLGKPVAAVPGRLSSPASRGTHALLMGGAQLIRGPQDALDLLYGVGTHRAAEPTVEIEPPLQRLLERVGSGEDTLAKLTRHANDSGEIAHALVELELRGLLVRGDGGRYLRSVGIPAK
jgi:DNA processing protein